MNPFTKNPTIRKVLNHYVIFVFGALFFIASIFAYIAIQAKSKADYETKQQEVVHFVDHLLNSNEFVTNIPNMITTAKVLMDDRSITSITIKDHSQHLYFKNEKNDSIYNKSKLSVQTIPLHISKSTSGYVEIQFSDYYFMKDSKNTFVIILLTCFIILVVALILSSRIFQNISKSIYSIVTVTKKISEGNLDNHIPFGSYEEIDILSQGITEMQSQLKNNQQIMHNNFDDLLTKSDLISQNNQEISALYEQAAALNNELETLYDDIKITYKETVVSLANAIEANDIYTRGHCERVTSFAILLAKEVGFAQQDLEHLEFASFLHDIGKIGIPLSILNNPNALNRSDYEVIKTHSRIGADIIKNIKFLEQSRTYILQHHERIDGSGYPKGLKADEITLGAKILSIADAFDAMTTSRPYRDNALSFKEAIQELENGIHKQFDAGLVQSFIRIIHRDYSTELA